MGKIRKISKIEYIKEEIKDIHRTITYITNLEYFTDEIILKNKLYDEEEILRYFEIDIEELKKSYNIFKERRNNNKIEEIDKILRISEELNDNWLIVDCN